MNAELDTAAKAPVCAYLQRGECKFGKDCRNSHDINPAAATQAVQQVKVICPCSVEVQANSSPQQAAELLQQAMAAMFEPGVGGGNAGVLACAPVKAVPDPHGRRIHGTPCCVATEQGSRGCSAGATAETSTAAAATTAAPMCSFEDMTENEQLLRAIYTEMKFEQPNKMQAIVLPIIMHRNESGTFKHVLAQACNGSGKTSCFVLAMLSSDKGKDTAAVYGSKMTEQVIIGTHGRLRNWIAKRQLEVDHIRMLVFDEADEMLKDESFADAAVRLVKTVRKRSPQVQLLLFSASFNDRVKDFASRVAPSASQVFVPQQKLSLEVFRQYNVMCLRPAEKLAVMRDMIFPNCEKLGQTIIFVCTKDTSRALHGQMQPWGYKITSIQADMSFEVCDHLVGDFRRGDTKILICTAGCMPFRSLNANQNWRHTSHEIYQRISHSVASGRKGAVFNLITGAQDLHTITAITSYLQQPIPELVWNNEDQFTSALNSAGLTDQTVQEFEHFPQRPAPEPVVLPSRAAARIPEVAAPPAPASLHPRAAWHEPGNLGRLAAGAARPEPAAQAAPAAAAASPSAAGRQAAAAAGRNPSADTELCPYAGCMNPACPNRHRNEQQRLNTIKEILAPEQLLHQPAIPTEVKQICGRLHSRLHALTADSKPPGELRAQLLSVVDAFDQARAFPPLPYHAYDGVQTQSRKLAEGIVKTLLHNQGVATEHFELAAGIGRLRCPDNNLKRALHVLRGYGNDGSHYGITNPMPMMQHRCDVLVVMGSMAAYARDRMLQQLL
uniref:RNA helicase n=1 Tax=Tetradesmus obliquus TaxID=3088 RepID=A0A383VSD2_TETOB